MSSIKNAVVSDDDREFRKHKKTIAERQRDFVSLGSALGYINAKKLYRLDGYDTFEDFVEVYCEMSRSYAYRQIDAARVVAILSPSGDKTGAGAQVKNEAQARALVPLGLDREAMLAVLTTTQKRGRITAASLADVRVELYPHTRVIDGEVVPDRPAIEPPKNSGDVGGVDADVSGQEPPADIPTSQVALVAGQPGSYSPVAPGEAPIRSGAVQPSAVGAVGDEPEGPATPSGDPNITEEQAPTSPVEPVLSLSGAGVSLDGDEVEEESEASTEDSSSADPTFIDAVDALWVALDRLDYDVTGPLLLDEEMGRIKLLGPAVTRAAELLERWRES